MSDLNVQLNLNMDNIDKTIRDLGKLSVNMETEIALGIYEVAELIKNKAEQNLMEQGLGGSSITVDVQTFDDHIEIYSPSDHADYVEFGTGIIGEESPHPRPSFGNWVYDINNHGEAGWVYIKNGKRYHTLGTRARPFMYPAWLYGSRIYTSVINKHLRRINTL